MTDPVRAAFVKRLEEEIAHYADVTFLLDEEFSSFLGPDTHRELLRVARTRLLPNLADVISGRATDCDTDDPEAYFQTEFDSLDALQSLFPGDDTVKSHIETASGVIEEAIEEARTRSKENSEEDRSSFDEDSYAGSRYGFYSTKDAAPASLSLFFGHTSIFDDIDL